LGWILSFWKKCFDLDGFGDELNGVKKVCRWWKKRGEERSKWLIIGMILKILIDFLSFIESEGV
jgi:hypothetical protein